MPDKRLLRIFSPAPTPRASMLSNPTFTNNAAGVTEAAVQSCLSDERDNNNNSNNNDMKLRRKSSGSDSGNGSNNSCNNNDVLALLEGNNFMTENHSLSMMSGSNGHGSSSSTNLYRNHLNSNSSMGTNENTRRQSAFGIAVTAGASLQEEQRDSRRHQEKALSSLWDDISSTSSYSIPMKQQQQQQHLKDSHNLPRPTSSLSLISPNSDNNFIITNNQNSNPNVISNSTSKRMVPNDSTASLLSAGGTGEKGVSSGSTSKLSMRVVSLPIASQTPKDVLGWKVRFLPRLLAVINPLVDLSACSFKMMPSKAATMRIVMFMEMGE